MHTEAHSASNFIQIVRVLLQQVSQAWGLYLHFLPAQRTLYIVSSTPGLKPIKSGLHNLAEFS